MIYTYIYTQHDIYVFLFLVQRSFVHALLFIHIQPCTGGQNQDMYTLDFRLKYTSPIHMHELTHKKEMYNPSRELIYINPKPVTCGT
jgi:hypothetical protein